MSTGWIVLIVVLVILIGVLVGLYFFGKKAEKQQASGERHTITQESKKRKRNSKKPIFHPQCWRIRQNI